jgi:hypothetical protein
MLTRYLYYSAAGGLAIIGLVLWAWGQPLICTCGYVKIWEGFIWSSGNSQHIADWYTLSHVLHGVLIILLGRLARGLIPFDVLLILAIVTGIGWEIVEHTDWVLSKFREATVYQGYLGDSVLNAMMDYVWMWAGFFVANALPTYGVFLLIVLMELIAGVFGRDNLTFTTIQLIHPLEAIDNYQQAIHPDNQPDGKETATD